MRLIAIVFFICLWPWNVLVMEIPAQSKKEETEDAFNYRIKLLSQSPNELPLKREIATNYGLGMIDQKGNLVLQKCKQLLCFNYHSHNYLLKSIRSNLGPSEKIIYIAASINGQYIAALTKKSGNLLALNIATENLYVINLATDDKKRIAATGLPTEYLKLKEGRTASYLKKGYQPCGSADSLNIIENPISGIAISSDGKRIGVANNNSIFITQKTAEDDLAELQSFKTYSFMPDESDSRQLIKILHIAFNEQANKLGVILGKYDKKGAPAAREFEILDLKLTDKESD